MKKTKIVMPEGVACCECALASKHNFNRWLNDE